MNCFRPSTPDLHVHVFLNADGILPTHRGKSTPINIGLCAEQYDCVYLAHITIHVRYDNSFYSYATEIRLRYIRLKADENQLKTPKDLYI